MGIPWFRGSEEAYKTALIKSEREMQALGQLGGASGSLFGTMRQQRKDEEDAALLEEKLQATIGPQTEAAKASTEQPGESGQDDSPLASTAPTMAAPPVDTSEPGTLQRLAGGLEENGLRMLRAGGGMLGLTSQRTPKLLDSARRIAGMQGQLEHENRGVKRLGVLQGVLDEFADPGEATYRASRGEVDLRGLARRPERSLFGTGGSLSDNALIYRATVLKDPDAIRALQGKIDYKQDTSNAPTRNYTGLMRRAFMEIVAEKQAKGMSPRDASDSTLDPEITTRALGLRPATVDEIIQQKLLQRGGGVMDVEPPGGAQPEPNSFIDPEGFDLGEFTE